MKIFESLSADEKLFAHLSHVYKLACKYYYEDLVEDDLDNETALAIMNCLGSDKTIKQGGIRYYNYMFPERYENEENPIFKSNIKYDAYGNIFAQLSLREALERYGGMPGDWPGVVKFIGHWYETNVDTYQGDPPGVNSGNHSFAKKYSIKELNLSKMDYIRDDCSGFVTACVLAFVHFQKIYDKLNETDKKIHDGLLTSPWSSIHWDVNNFPNKQRENFMKNIGFDILPYKFEDLQPFDIIAGNCTTGGKIYNNGSFHHIEIYGGKQNGADKSWSWGSVHNLAKGGMPSAMSKGREGNGYNTIFRLRGLGKITDEKILGFKRK